MNRLRRLFRNWTKRPEIEADLSEELRGYVDELTARNEAKGMEPIEARRRAIAEIGSLEVLKERIREERTGFRFEAYVLKPIKMAARRLWHTPAFTITAVLTLTLAIGANSALLSIADYLLFRSLPYRDSDRVHILLMRDPGTGKFYTNIPLNYVEAINAIDKGLSKVALSDGAPAIPLTTGEKTVMVTAGRVTPNFFEVVGASPYRGRLFNDQDAEQPERTAVLSYPAWIKYFAGDDRVIGTTVHLGPKTFLLLGVLRPDYVAPSFGNPEVVQIEPPPRPGAKGGTFFPVVRRAAGVSRDQAQAQIDAAIAGLGPDGPQKGEATPAIRDVPDVLYSYFRPALTFLVAAALVVLLIGVANLAITLAVHVNRSAREIGVRAALGASRLQLALPFVFEALIIGVVAAILATMVTAASFKLLLAQVPEAVYTNAHVGVDLRVALITLAIGVASGILFVAIPAWNSTRADAQTLIQGREERILRRGRLGGPLISAQVALSVLLVFEAVGAIQTFVGIVNQPLGFDTRNVAVLNVQANPKEDLQAMYERIWMSLRQHPAVASVGASHQLPLPSNGPFDSLRQNGERVRGTGLVLILPGYFETLGIPLKRGRMLTSDDLREDTDAAVITEDAARIAFPGKDPLGATFENSKGRKFHVVGVVADTLRPPSIDPVAYILRERGLMYLVVRTKARDEGALAAIQRDVNLAAPGAVVSGKWFDDTLDAQPRLRDPRFQTLVLGSFGGLALGLMALGVFGVIAFAVAARMKELGIRMAMGARANSLVLMTIRQGITPVLIGLGIGLALTRWASRLAQAYVPLIQPPAFGETLALATIAVAAAALIATYLPARRASRVDPVITLRID